MSLTPSLTGLDGLDGLAVGRVLSKLGLAVRKLVLFAQLLTRRATAYDVAVLCDLISDALDSVEAVLDSVAQLASVVLGDALVAVDARTRAASALWLLCAFDDDRWLDAGDGRPPRSL